MKKLRKLIQDYNAYGEAGVKITISLWHVVAIIGLVLLALYLFKWK